MNLTELTSRAQTLRQQPVTPATKQELDGLRETAQQSGVGPAFDATLTKLFRDVYGGKAPPPLAVTSMGGAAKSAAANGTKGGAVLAFHAMRSPAAIANAVASRIPELKTTVMTPIPLEAQFKPLTPTEKAAARSALAAELGSLHVTHHGARVTLLEKLTSVSQAKGLDANRLLDVLATVKVGYDRVEAGTGNKPPGYQQTNWKHTRLEVDRLLDAASLAKLTPAQTETALYASFLSDAVKAPTNFLVHNVHGAQAALLVLSRLVPPPSSDMLEDVARATLEHQVGPPNFMGNAAMRGALMGAGVDKGVVDGICAKVSKPLEPENQTADQAQLAFSDVEKAALEKIGIFAWTVPHEGARHSQASRAVIDGDSLVNYACPDGWAKLAELHGPDQPEFLREPRFVDGLTGTEPQWPSAHKSFLDAKSVVSATSMPLYEAGRERTQKAIERVLLKLEQWVAAQPDVPRTAGGKVPYFDGALDYKDDKQVAFARLLRAEGARLLRAEEGL